MPEDPKLWPLVRNNLIECLTIVCLCFLTGWGLIQTTFIGFFASLTLASLAILLLRQLLDNHSEKVDAFQKEIQTSHTIINESISNLQEKVKAPSLDHFFKEYQ